MRRAIVQIGLALGGVAAFLGFLIWLNPTLLDRLRGQEAYLLPLAEVDCPAPPGMTRSDFLDEVQYYASLPGTLDLLDDTLPETMRQAFVLHPWVRSVPAARVTAPRGLKVELEFRQPVLAVRTGPDLRAVDEQGVLLPRKADVTGLPVLDAAVGPPQGPEGSPWGDGRVLEAARKAGATSKKK